MAYKEPEKERQRQRDKYRRNRQRYLARSKKWREANKDRANENQKRWREANPEYANNYYHANREKILDQVRKRYAAKIANRPPRPVKTEEEKRLAENDYQRRRYATNPVKHSARVQNSKRKQKERSLDVLTSEIITKI